VIVALEPVLVSTVPGSCVAVTMYSCSRCFGAICHTMLPACSGQGSGFRYVDIAIKYLYAKALEYDAVNGIVVKLFGTVCAGSVPVLRRGANEKNQSADN
jgi:chemotaxis protein CheD